MNFKFKIQGYQTDAVENTVSVFAGQPSRDAFQYRRNLGKMTTNLFSSDEEYAGYRNSDIEMETGTGKTYVYIKTMFELNKRYGWNKFIVVVPSIAIREGVDTFGDTNTSTKALGTVSTSTVKYDLVGEIAKRTTITLRHSVNQKEEYA